MLMFQGIYSLPYWSWQNEFGTVRSVLVGTVNAACKGKQERYHQGGFAATMCDLWCFKFAPRRFVFRQSFGYLMRVVVMARFLLTHVWFVSTVHAIAKSLRLAFACRHIVFGHSLLVSLASEHFGFYDKGCFCGCLGHQWSVHVVLGSTIF
jgi:hypothetical protein